MPCFPSKARTAEYREGLYVDCPYYEIVKVPALSRFGFVLSCTTFECSSLTINVKATAFAP